MERMRTLGHPAPPVGHGVLALPTLIHRGPGGYTPGGERCSRRVVFFTIQPMFTDERGAHNGDTGSYDPGSQVNAAWLLHHTEKLPVLAGCVPAVRAVYKSLGFSLSEKARVQEYAGVSRSARRQRAMCGAVW